MADQILDESMPYNKKGNEMTANQKMLSDEIMPVVESSTGSKLFKNKGYLFLVLAGSFIMFSVAAM